MNKELDKSENYYNKILQEFEEYNNTTTSIYDLDSFNVLIILCDGTNVTNYDEVDNKEEIIFISENLYNQKNLVRKYNYPNLKAVITSNFNSMINDISYMFSSCYNLSTVVGLENWDVSNVTDMHGLFKNCNLLNNIDSLSKWNVRSVTNMESMFHDCSMLTNLDALSNWDVSNVVNMDYMFENCNHLQSLEALKNWDVSSLSNLEATFRDCSSLTNLEG